MDYDYRTSLGRQLHLCMLLLSRKIDKNFSAAGLDVSYERWKVMIPLWETPLLTQTELAQHLHKDKSWMTRALDEMQAKGWVKRVPHATDRRINQVCLTQAGLDLKPALLIQTGKAIEQASEGIDPESMQKLIGQLNQIQTNLREDD